MYSHSLYCCSWANSAGLRHTQLLSPISEALGRGSVCVSVGGATGSDGDPLVSYDTEVKCVSKFTHDLKGAVGGREK